MILHKALEPLVEELNAAPSSHAWEISRHFHRRHLEAVATPEDSIYSGAVRALASTAATHRLHEEGFLLRMAENPIVVTDGMVIPGPSKVLSLQAGQEVVLAPGLTSATVIGGFYVPATAPGVKIDPRITFKAPDDFPAAGVAQICATATAGCGYDASGLPIQCVQIIQWPASAAKPSGVDLNGIRGRNNVLGPNDPNGIGYNHGVYNQSGVDVVMENALFEDILGGWALHFYPDSQGSRCTAVTARNCRGAVVFWGAAVANNRVDALKCESLGPRGPVTIGGGANSQTNVVTMGGGYVPPGSTIDVPGAIVELNRALDNFVNQLGYSVTRTKKTHVYAALVKLGGTWR